MSWYFLLFGLGLITSVIAINFGIVISSHFNFVDQPGDHKQHQINTPFVGGVGVISTLLMVLTLSYHHQMMSSVQALVIATGALVIFFTGLADDLWQLNYKVRLLIESLVVCFMVYGGGVVLSNLGQIVWNTSVELGSLALFFTLFATVGVINAINMIDGIDGLSGLISLITLTSLAIVALLAGQNHYLILIIALAAGITGFLGFNLRCFGRHRALVFLGDNGSILLGFLFAWLFIGLSQGQAPAMTPVTALWLFAVPLMDTVTVISRRLWFGKSPFQADRFHLHHLLLRAGFRTTDAVFAISLVHGLFSAVGLAGLYWGVGEALMFAGFLGGFAGYFSITSSPWRFVPSLRRLYTRLGLVLADCQGVFIGPFSSAATTSYLQDILWDKILLGKDYSLRVYEAKRPEGGGFYLYAILEMRLTEENRSKKEFRQLVGQLRKYFSADHDVKIRQYVWRNPMNDNRINLKSTNQDRRQADRRGTYAKKLKYESAIRQSARRIDQKRSDLDAA